MRNKLRRPLAFLLSAVMIVTMSGTPVHAVADRGQPETGLCEHHAAHTDDCGYTEETPGTPCGHEHTEDCYTEVTECVHEHTPECYPEETEDSVSDNEATPANAEEREPENCPHICDGESGCITEKLDCRHEHDSECGYTESTPGTPCTYVCEICNPQDSGEADEEPETGIIKQEQCSCLTLCTEGQINPDCPVCGAEDAGLSDCKGKAEKEDTKQPEDTGICKHHQEHDDACGYQPESEDSEGSPCTYECRICPIEDLIATLPDKVTEDNADEVRAQLDEILALFSVLTEDEQEQIDLSRGYELQGALDGANDPAPITESVEYQEASWDGSQVTYESKTETCTLVENSAEAVTWTAGWYAVSGTVTIDQPITVTDAVNLILTDGCTLTAAKGIVVTDGNSLTIYAQSENGGTLNATGTTDDSGNASAGIGGSTTIFDSGSITIHGGVINATGGASKWYSGAGIGGGTPSSGNGGNSGTIKIYGGTITAESRGFSVGAGIGGGGSGGTGNGGAGTNISIYGGNITAMSYSDNNGGAGIGGGSGETNGGTGNITIGGGTIHSTGGSLGAGIGGGSGGTQSGNGTVTISGGKVTAVGGNYAAGIGGGGGTKSQYLTWIGGIGSVTITGGIVDAKGNGSGEYAGAPIGNGGNTTAAATVNKTTGIVFENGAGTVCGDVTLDGSYTVPADYTLNIPAGASLSGSGTLSGGSAFTTENLTEDMISVPEDWHYTGEDLTEKIKGAVSLNGEVTICGQTFTASTDGWELSVEKVSELEYTVKYTHTDKGTLSKTVTIARGQTALSDVVTYKEDGTTPANTFSVGETIIVKATATFPANNAIMAAAEFDTPAGEQMAVYYDNIQISAPSTVENGVHTMTVDTSNLPESALNKEIGLTVKYIESGNASGATATTNVTVTAVARVKKDSTTTYVGALADAFTEGNSGATVTLLSEVDLGSNYIRIRGSSTFTLDLNGQTVKASHYGAFYISGGSLTIQDSGTGGKIESSNITIEVTGGTLSIKSGTVSGYYGVQITRGTVNISGGVISGTENGLWVNGGGNIVLSGGAYSGRHAIWVDGNASVTMKDMLAPGYAYHQNDIPIAKAKGLVGDEVGEVPLDAKPAWLTGTVTVKACTHTGEGVCTYTHNENASTHTKTCLACGQTLGTENCTYTFSGTTGTCAACGDSVTVTVSGTDGLIYDGTEKEPGVTVMRGETALTAGTDYTVAYTDNKNAGENKATVAVTIGNGQGTYTGNFSIGKATLYVAPNSQTIRYGESIREGASAILTRGLATGDHVVGVTLTPNARDVPGGKIIASEVQIQNESGADVTGNYEITYVPGALIINKAPAPAIIWPTANDLTYGQKLSESTLSGGSTEYGSFAWAKPDTIPTAGTSGYSVTFTPSDSTEQNYEPIATKTQDVNVTVAQAAPTVTVEVKMSDSAKGRVADLTVTVTGAQNGAAPTGEITITGNGETKTLTLADGKATHTWDVSDKKYTVTAAYSGDTNYQAVNGQLTFDAAKKNQEALAISPVEAKTYGDLAFTLATTGGSGSGAVSFTSSDPSIISINGSTATIHKAGTVTITARKAADNNYNEAVAVISVTIGKRPITLTADSFTVVKGAAMPTLTYQAAGLVNGDTFTTDPTMTTSVSDTNTLGEYAIVISGGILTNGDSYQITYVNGKLTVTDKIPVQLTIAATPDSLTGGGTVTLTISGLPAGGEATVSCSDSSINVTGSGTSWKATLPNETATYTFTANYSGDTQHSSAMATCTVSVTKRTNGGGSSGGGNGNSGGSGNGGGSSSGGGSSNGNNGSSGGGSTIVARPDETKPDTPTTSQTKPATPDKNGNVAVDNGTVQSAINTAKNDAKKNGNTANGVAVVIPVTPKEGQNSFNVTINAQTLNTLVREKVKRLEINIEGVVVGGMDTKLLKWLDTLSANGDVIFRVKKTDPSGLSKEAKAAIGTRPVYDLSLVYLSGGKETPITDFGGHTIAVRLPYAPAKEEQAGNLYAVYVDGKGKVEWLTRSSYDPDLGTVVFEAGHFSIYGIGYKNPAPDFTDIKNHWAADNIIFVASRGLLAGTGNNQFSPDTGMTRGMFVTALGRLAGIDQADYKTGKFTDVKADAYYAPYVNWAAEKGIVNGTSATTFSPDTNITREQMAVIMANYAKKLGYDLPVAHEAVTFADNAQISGWAAKEVKAMQQAGIMAGKGGNRFDPKGTATRAEVATVLRRFVEIVIDPQTAQGWMQNHSGSWQYLKNGKPATGWLQDDKKWYWLDSNGWMFTGGWKQIDGKWYYFYSDGSMAVNTTIDGYAIGSDGARK